MPNRYMTLLRKGALPQIPAKGGTEVLCTRAGDSGLPLKSNTNCYQAEFCPL